MTPTNDEPKTVAGRRQRIRQQLINLGLRPREAEARASIAQMHLSDFNRGASA